MMPINIPYAEYYLTYNMMQGFITFAACYFSWWPSLVCSLITLVVQIGSRNKYFGDTVESLTPILVLSIIWHSMNLLVFHVLVTKACFMYVHTEVLRDCNDKLLDSLEEGVVILDESSENIIYFNEAASGSQRYCESSMD